MHQLDLRTGQITSFALPLNFLANGYTRPGGAGILALGSVRGSDTNSRLIRYDLRGHLRKVLWTGFTDGVRSAPGGRMVAVGVSSGLDLVAVAGGLIRRLLVPGVAANCVPIRWWSATAVLASCTANEVPGLDAQRLWLVPVGGSRPKALTPQRPDHGPTRATSTPGSSPPGSTWRHRDQCAAAMWS